MTAMTQKIRKLLSEGHDTKYIVSKLKCKPQQVYQTRYTDKRKQQKIFAAPLSLWQRIVRFFRRK